MSNRRQQEYNTAHLGTLVVLPSISRIENESLAIGARKAKAGQQQSADGSQRKRRVIKDVAKSESNSIFRADKPAKLLVKKERIWLKLQKP